MHTPPNMSANTHACIHARDSCSLQALPCCSWMPRALAVLPAQAPGSLCPQIPLPSLPGVPASAGEASEPSQCGRCVHSPFSLSRARGTVGSAEKGCAFAVLLLPGSQSHLPRRPPGPEPAARGPALGEGTSCGSAAAWTGRRDCPAASPPTGRFVQVQLCSTSHQSQSPSHGCPPPSCLCLDFITAFTALPLALLCPVSGPAGPRILSLSPRAGLQLPCSKPLSGSASLWASSKHTWQLSEKFKSQAWVCALGVSREATGQVPTSVGRGQGRGVDMRPPLPMEGHPVRGRQAAPSHCPSRSAA